MSREITLDSVKAGLLRFFVWERDQFRALLPPAALRWLLGRGAREAVARAGATEIVLAAEPGHREIRVSGAEIAATSLDAALARRGLSRKSLAIVLEMPAASFLTRGFEAPVAALGQLPQIVAAEIERRTPFGRDDVLVGREVASPGATGKASVRLTLLRRDRVEPALASCGLGLGDLALIRAEKAADSSTEPPSIAVGDAGGADRRFRRAALAMIALAALLLLAGLGAIFWRQAREADELDARIARMAARAAHVRQIADRAAKESKLASLLRDLRRENAPLTDLWEEISRVTPDGAFLTDFHLSENKTGERGVDLAGFAQSAVGLPLLFDQSKFFADAALTAPITSDPREQRESFSLRLKLRPRAATEARR
ncbi:PilN domain-containing protein [Rhodoblastus acidophilus]|uniref:PilN domain-containing protein n=1 Tax=Candidatus Rhodoblastus alkanivorans TaxID=2954117 RepID=A0ABS9ZBZ0_9HYPH|nr:PilN domain-containing protein [Candidatus Rhodoblastus alkanivorans]MCI4677158.1 PilN domain-containing protein [Candidatus Rhodoblastus alkanivorans]MCI4684511.1 PilN domain-containing protein [Candidatus Rhodoblastus alkanivorans]MDI4641832.1 PilN domain-containing protein [Rhodoblastus acidophilus]